MTGFATLIVLAVTAVLLLITLRARREADALRRSTAALQHDLEQQHARLETQMHEAREWLAVMAHELRSPVSAVLGYSELLADGTLGPLEPRADDAIRRMQQSAEQLLRIIEGIDDMAADGSRVDSPPDTLSAAALMSDAMTLLRSDAEARGISLVLTPGDAALATREEHALRSLVLALSAALKVSTGATISLAVHDGERPVVVISGSRLDPGRDDPDRRAGDARLTGAGLRIALARRTAAFVHATLSFQQAADGPLLLLELPRLGQTSPDA